MATQKAMQQSQYEPCSTIRFSCPLEILELWINPLLVQFMRQYPFVLICGALIVTLTLL
ncbi:hypothetical protein INT80_09785 [Gallibacterium anatis]|uniref:Uncharacterized protein n=1 Tax=Gallibacterium anatis TaxID=750 RepID=A0A930UWN2_9PAST|nr:hypothetical protein [Gallibacterium anatis]